MKLLLGLNALLLSLCTLHSSVHFASAQSADLSDAEFAGHINIEPDESGNFAMSEEDLKNAAAGGGAAGGKGGGKGEEMKTPSPEEMQRQCTKAAKEGMCEDETTGTREACPEICGMWDAQQKLAPRTILVDVDRDDYSFFDLASKLEYEQTWVNYERFQGYLTVVANVGKICDTNDDIDLVILAMQTLFNVMPYSLNIVIFPFRPKNTQKDDEDCSNFDAAIKKASTDPQLKRKLFIMEEAELNGPNTHPVYKYLKAKADLEPMLDTHSSFFFVNGEGTKIDLFQAASFSQLRGHIVRLTRDEF